MTLSSARDNGTSTEHVPIRIATLFGARAYFGSERSNVEALAALRAQGCAILCITRDEDWPELRELRSRLAERGFEIATVPYIDLPRRGWILKTLARNPVAFLRGNLRVLRLLRAFGATHLHLFNQFYAANFYPALAWSRLPIVYRSGDEPILHNAVWRFTWRLLRGRVDRFVAVSEFIKRCLVSHGVSAGRVAVIYTLPGARGGPAVAFPGACAHPDAFRIVYVGQLSAEKGVAALIAAFAGLTDRFPQAHLLIAGPIGDFGAALRAKVEADSRLHGRAHFVGNVENVPDLLARCHLHVCPSIWEEPGATVVGEAKAAGLASVVFPSGVLPELVEHGADGWITEDISEQALAKALALYLADPVRARREGQAARMSLARLDGASFGKRWLDVYRASADRSGCPEIPVVPPPEARP